MRNALDQEKAGGGGCPVEQPILRCGRTRGVQGLGPAGDVGGFDIAAGVAGIEGDEEESAGCEQIEGLGEGDQGGRGRGGDAAIAAWEVAEVEHGQVDLSPDFGRERLRQVLVAGVMEGDAICQARAQAANLPNPSLYKAWLSDDTTVASARLSD